MAVLRPPNFLQNRACAFQRTRLLKIYLEKLLHFASLKVIYIFFVIATVLINWKLAILFLKFLTI